jgi:hypothetical protein
MITIAEVHTYAVSFPAPTAGSVMIPRIDFSKSVTNGPVSGESTSAEVVAIALSH